MLRLSTFFTRKKIAEAVAAPSAPDALSAEQIALIRTTFRKVVPISTTAAELFYDRLFFIAPDVKPLFVGESGSPEMAAQGKKLMAMLAIVVQELDNPDVLMPAAADLAKRHVDYSVKAAHYAPVGEALLWALEQGLQDEFTADVKEAWASAYGVLSSAMIQAAYGREAA